MNANEMQSAYPAQVVDAAMPAHSKRCPRCGELLFDDMDVCYGCLYDFTREPYRLPEGMIDQSLEGPQDALPQPQAPQATAPGRLPAPQATAPGRPQMPQMDVPTPPQAPLSAQPPAPQAAVPIQPQATAPAQSPASLATPVPVFPSAPRERRLVLKTHELNLALPLPSKGLTLGRAPDNDIVLYAGAFAEHHLMFVPRADDVLAVGLVAGAFERVDGPAHNGCASLRTGDAISVGGIYLQLTG